jgi:superfamily II DNA or RNA helicase
VQVAINIAGLYGSRMGFSQRFGRILRPKDETAMFYELVIEGTVEQDFSERHREYLVGQGYGFDIIDLTGMDVAA